MPATREAYNGFCSIVGQEERFDKFFTIADLGKKALRQKACSGFSSPCGFSVAEEQGLMIAIALP